MNGADFNKPIQPEVTSNVRESGTVDKKSAERQAKLADLKARVETGQYKVDTRTLAQRIIDSGVLNNGE